MIEIKKILAKVAPNGREKTPAQLRSAISDVEQKLADAREFVFAADARANTLLMADEDDALEDPTRPGPG